MKAVPPPAVDSVTAPPPRSVVLALTSKNVLVPPPPFNRMLPSLLIVLPPTPAIVRAWPLSRVTEFEPPSVRLATVGLMPLMTTGLFLALVTVALAEVEFGTVADVQLAALLQRLSEPLPFQSWASTPLGQPSMSPDRSNAGKIDAILPGVALA